MTLPATATEGTGTLACCAVPPPLGEVPVLGEAQLAAMAKALGHPARVRIVRFLEHSQHCVTSEVVAEVGLAQSTISEHLRILREAGLVHGEAEGPRTRYCVDRNGLAAFKAAIAAL